MKRLWGSAQAFWTLRTDDESGSAGRDRSGDKVLSSRVAVGKTAKRVEPERFAWNRKPSINVIAIDTGYYKGFRLACSSSSLNVH